MLPPVYQSYLSLGLSKQHAARDFFNPLNPPCQGDLLTNCVSPRFINKPIHSCFLGLSSGYGTRSVPTTMGGRHTERAYYYGHKV